MWLKIKGLDQCQANLAYWVLLDVYSFNLESIKMERQKTEE